MLKIDIAAQSRQILHAIQQQIPEDDPVDNEVPVPVDTDNNDDSEWVETNGDNPTNVIIHAARDLALWL